MAQLMEFGRKAYTGDDPEIKRMWAYLTDLEDYLRHVLYNLGSENIGEGAIGAAQIQDGALTIDKISANMGREMDISSNKSILLRVKKGDPVEDVENAALVLNEHGIGMKTGGKFTVESGNFGVDEDGKMNAQAGSIGGWEIVQGALYSGSGSNRVRISTEDATYAIWAGADDSENAPFRVSRDGTVYMTKLYVTDQDGVAQSTPVNLRTNYWKMDAAYARAVKTIAVNNGILNVELYDGTIVNFSKAAVANIIQTWSGGRLIISSDTNGMVLIGQTSTSVSSYPRNIRWVGNVCYFDVTSDNGTIVSNMSIDASHIYQAGYMAGQG